MIARDTLRWNGWGRLGVSMDFSRAKEALLLAELGRRFGCRLARAPAPCALEAVRLPPSKLSPDTLARLRTACGEQWVRTSVLERVTHALGKSLPDLLRLRSGEIDAAPEAVVVPPDEGAVAAVLRVAAEARLGVVPFGGGTSVVGGVDARPGADQSGVLSLDTTRLDQLVSFDATSGTATFQAGIDGPALEAALGRLGRTLGHFPQSFEHSTLGGWIATRSSGQQSNGYGAIEDLVVALRVVTPEGVLRTIQVPRAASGPDLNELVLGSEGTLGVIVEATLRTSASPGASDARGMLFRRFEDGIAGVRDVVQEGVALSMLRLSDDAETALGQVLRRHPGRRFDLTESALGLAAQVGYADERCALVYCADAPRAADTGARLGQARRLLRARGGLPLGRAPGRSWRRDRFRTPYLRDWLLDHGVAVDTFETSIPWSGVLEAHDAILKTVRRGLEAHAGAGIAMAHLSHSYVDGASLYFTFLYPLDAANALAQWQALKREATEAVLAAGGTLSHHHGVGRDHLPWMEREKGPLGLRLLRAAKQALDPKGLMNPGKLV